MKLHKVQDKPPAQGAYNLNVGGEEKREMGGKAMVKRYKCKA